MRLNVDLFLYYCFPQPLLTLETGAPRVTGDRRAGAAMNVWRSVVASRLLGARPSLQPLLLLLALSFISTSLHTSDILRYVCVRPHEPHRLFISPLFSVAGLLLFKSALQWT